MADTAKHNGALDGKSPEVRELYCSYRGRVRTHRRTAYAFLGLAGVAVASAVYLLFDPEAVERYIDWSIQAVAERVLTRELGINDIALCDGAGIAVGNDGAIGVLADDGGAWNGVGSDTNDDLARVVFSADCRTAMAAGDAGVVLRSAYGGATWTALPTATRTQIRDIALNADGDRAIAVGEDGRVKGSSDGGDSWSDAGNVADANLNGVAIGAADNIVAVGADKTILYSSDGAAWTARPVSAGGDRDDLEDVAFSGPNGRTAVAVGDNGLIAVSGDSGESWRGVGWSGPERNERRADYRAVAFGGDGRTALAVGGNGSIARSDDGGANWRPVPSGTGNRLNDVALSGDGRIAVAAGQDGRILVSVDGGANWCARDSRTASRLDAVALAPVDGGEAHAYIGGENATALRLEISPETCEGNVDIVRWNAPEETEDDPYAGLSSEQRFTVIIYRDIMAHLFRIGIVLLLIFLVQHLVALVRYNLRLAAFYHARADAILMSEDKPLPHSESIDELEQIMRCLSPDNVDFGRQPKTVAGETMRLAQFVMRGRKGNSSA